MQTGRQLETEPSRLWLTPREILHSREKKHRLQEEVFFVAAKRGDGRIPNISKSVAEAGGLASSLYFAQEDAETRKTELHIQGCHDMGVYRALLEVVEEAK
jgi:hypothetical protein